MRATFVTGAADPTPYRYITPWREDPDVLTVDLQGTDHPERFPFDPMERASFVPLVWRVRTWEFEWALSFTSQASGFSFTRGGTAEAVATCLFPPTGVAGELADNEEWRLGAGFRHNYNVTTIGVPGYSNATFTVEAIVGGLHQYIEGAYDEDGNLIIPQRFRPEVRFSAVLDLNPDGGGGGAEEIGEWSILSSREQGVSCGASAMLFTYWDFANQAPAVFNSTGRMAFNGRGTSIIVGPSTAFASLSIRPAEWWGYAQANGANPIFSTTSGIPLLDTTDLPASPQPSGRPVVNSSVVGGVRFVA